MTARYVVWYGSVAPSNAQAWWVLDNVAEAKWGYLAAPAAGPFATREQAQTDQSKLNGGTLAGLQS